MDKLLIFPGKTDRGIFTFVIDKEIDHLTKTAAEYHPEISAYINGAKTIPGKTQILLTALGAGEFWGSNVNGDYFPESALAYPGKEYGFKTFETNAKVYKHHINKDPSANYGDVTLAVYNPTYHRVELIISLDNIRASDIVASINSGDYPEWSMGCRVPYDICSICGNKAPSRKEYCNHLKYYMNRIDPETGKHVHAINLHPRFFDISQVLIGADKIAKTLMKVAASAGRATPFLGSAYIAEKMATEEKAAEIEKQIPASDPPASQDTVETMAAAIPEVKAQEKPLPEDVLDSLGSMPLKDVFSTLPLLGILPKPQEFQRIVLISIGKKKAADHLDHHNMCFDPKWVEEPSRSHMNLVDMGGSPSERIIHMLKPFMGERSYAAPHLGKRLVVMIKSAGQEYLPNFIKMGADAERDPIGLMPILMLAAGMYAAFSKKAPGQAVGKIDNMIANHPLLAGALVGAVPLAFNAAAGEEVRGEYDASGPLENPDRTDIFSRIEERKSKPYLKIAGPLLGPAGKRLFLGIPAAYMASGVMQKHREANPYEQEGRIRSFIRRNPDIIGAALGADAVMARSGKGSTKYIKGLKNFGNKAWDKASKAKSAFTKKSSFETKESSAQDFLTNALIWPVAFGPKNLPGRIVGGLFDQAVFDTSGKLLAKKKQPTKP